MNFIINFLPLLFQVTFQGILFQLFLAEGQDYIVALESYVHKHHRVGLIFISECHNLSIYFFFVEPINFLIHFFRILVMIRIPRPSSHLLPLTIDVNFFVSLILFMNLIFSVRNKEAFYIFLLIYNSLILIHQVKIFLIPFQVI